MSVVLPADKRAAAPEIAVYLKESVGNSTRIDYGTGNSALCHSSYQLALIGYVATGSLFPPQIKKKLLLHLNLLQLLLLLFFSSFASSHQCWPKALLWSTAAVKLRPGAVVRCRKVISAVRLSAAHTLCRLILQLFNVSLSLQVMKQLSQRSSAVSVRLERSGWMISSLSSLRCSTGELSH